MDDLEPNLLLTDTTPLRGSDAVAALLVLEDGRYLLQERDRRPGIWYPGHWGLFGGAVEPGESMTEALLRELAEEIELVPSRPAVLFTRLDFDLTPLSHERFYRQYFVVAVDAQECAALRLHEGRQVRAFSAAEIFGGLRVTPYDSFALWLHAARGRLGGGGFDGQAGTGARQELPGRAGAGAP
jgi:8-oxo-dGTP pyrophosphatase MutT (NUDIX family)